MKIGTLLQSSQPIFSFEFFPPKTPKEEARLFETIADLRPLKPAFVSMTYGAGGGGGRSVEWVGRIQNEIGITAMAHLTCGGNTRETLESTLHALKNLGVENIMAIRGDPPKDSAGFQPMERGFRYASELVAFIRERFGDAFCLAGGAYPEGHVEAVSLEADLQHLKTKVEAGLDFIVTNLFFNNALYLGFVERARKIGIGVPILPGLMPITNLGQIRRFMDLCGASIPGPLLSRLEKAETLEDVTRIGVEHTTRQAAELLETGVPGIHFYTLNKSPATRLVMENLAQVGAMSD
ncbi:MAG: methylenetetrahydrofolate reductase [NAD(P)H] [Meiothermus sp.]